MTCMAVNEICNLKLSTIVWEMFTHFLNHKDSKEIHTGVITSDEDSNQHVMPWSQMKDPGIF